MFVAAEDQFRKATENTPNQDTSYKDAIGKHIVDHGCRLPSQGCGCRRDGTEMIAVSTLEESVLSFELCVLMLFSFPLMDFQFNAPYLIRSTSSFFFGCQLFHSWAAGSFFQYFKIRNSKPLFEIILCLLGKIRKLSAQSI